MKLRKIELKGCIFPTIDLDDNINVIIGYTGDKKTLLYKLVLFGLGVSAKIDFDNVSKKLKGLSEVTLSFESENQVHNIRRNISEKFLGYIDDKKYSSLKTFKKDVKSIFDIRDVRILNGAKTNGFGLDSYLDFIFVPEEQLTTNKTIFEKDGYSEMGKIKECFRYIVSGGVVDQAILKKQAAIKKDRMSISSFKTAINRRFKKPSSSELHKRQKLLDDLNEIDIQLGDLCGENKKIVQKKKELSLSSNRLSMLLKTYENDFSEIEAALSYKELSNDGSLSEIDLLYYGNLKAEISSIKKSITFISNEIKDCDVELSKSAKRINDLGLKKQECTNELPTFKFIDDYNSLMENTETIITAVEASEKLIETEIQKTKLAINDNYNEKLKALARNISLRLNRWGLNVEVTFNDVLNDFYFDGEKLAITPKGYKNIYSLAVAIEMLLLGQENKISTINTIMVDSLLIATDSKDFSNDSFVKLFTSDMSRSNIQLIVLENHGSFENAADCKIIRLSETNRADR